MNREVCIHGNELTHFAPGETSASFTLCLDCLAEMKHKPYNTEREELAKELFVKFSVAKTFREALTDEVAHEAFKAADVFFKTRDEERRK